jgi:hypothetical protein
MSIIHNTHNTRTNAGAKIFGMREQELNLPALGCEGLCIQQTNKHNKLRGDRQAPSFYEENPLVGKGQQ